MDYSKYIKVVYKAVEDKSKFGDPCNNCGWCCLTEVCVVGAELSGSKQVPCQYLDSEHKCSLVVKNPAMAEVIGTGIGCCAMTQQEAMDLME